MWRSNLYQWRPFRGRAGALFAIVVLAVCALLTAYLDSGGPPVSGRARISDGDSFHLGDQRVRLLGLDAPELDQTCRDSGGKDWPCGRVARDRLASLVAGKTLDCLPGGHDRFGRILATCSADGRDLGGQMVEAGLAISADDYPKEQERAQKARRGLWIGQFQTPRAWRDGHGQETQAPSGWDWLPRFGF